MRNLFAATVSITLFCLVGLLAYLYYPENHFALQYQAAADCQRRQDIHQTAGLIERYFKLTGRYPLDAGADRHALSVVLTEEQLPRQFEVNPPPEISGELRPAAALKSALELALGEQIRLPADPQTAFAWGSRYYLYQLDSDGDFSLSAALFAATEHTHQQTRYRHLYRVGSKSSAPEKIRHYSQISTAELECEKTRN